MRTRSYVDNYVESIIVGRLQKPDLVNIALHNNEPKLRELASKIDEHNGRILRAQSDYDAEIIEAMDFKRIRDKERAKIHELEVERNQLVAGDNAKTILADPNPAEAYENAHIGHKREVIRFLCTVELNHGSKGKKGFDPSTIEIRWKDEKDEHSK